MIQWNREKGFQNALEATFAHEGGWSNHPMDRGGKTMLGITEASWTDYCRRRGFLVKPIQQVTREDAERFYRLEYWDAMGLSGMDHEPVAIEIFDSSVNCGRGNGAKFAQRAFNFLRHNSMTPLVEDGAFGPRTRAAVNLIAGKYLDSMLAALNGEQYRHYQSIVDRDPSQRSFSRGWSIRCLVKAELR